MKLWKLGWLATALLVGCGDNELGVQKLRPNQPPETLLSSGPPDSTDAAHYRVQLYWSGSDRDGTIDHFDFILIDHPPARSHLDPGDDATRVIVEVPAPDDPRWTGTTSSDTTLITLADTLRRDPRPGPGEDGSAVRDTPFERWHTFFVRAVDNEGIFDSTPDYRSFNSTNIAPTVALLPPVRAGHSAEFEGPPVIVFNWEGEDPVDATSTIDPVASRFVIIGTTVVIGGTGDKYVNFPDSLYVLPQRYEWSPWRAWGALDRSGTRGVVSGLARIGDYPGAGYYLFAVQAMDEAGAITPVFDYQTAGKNNVCRLRVKGNIGPVLTVREEFLGTQTFVGGSRPIRLDIAAGQPINFRWSADASAYGGEIVGYRYGWDIRNHDEDQEWSSWSVSNTSAPVRSFSTGSHRFNLQVRDNAESITEAIYELTVHTVTLSRSLLWVDDTDFQTDIDQESQEEARWLQVLSEVAAAGGFEFQPSQDVYDVQANRFEPPSIQKVFDYRAIVWSNRSGRNGGSALRRAAQFYDPIPSRNQNAARGFNYINIYLANGGSLWINGFRPAKQLWPDERLMGEEANPVNVTNWDDPIEPHPPGIDSVGTASLLYKMGIEMFDVGSAIESPRWHRDHFCRALERYESAGIDSQVTTSSTDGAHAHDLAIARADVEAFVPVERTYMTRSELDHRHAVTLAASDFVALRNGETIEVGTSESASPSPHSHTYTLVDRVGHWGAPRLQVSGAWPQAGTGGRTNVEIYNMPNGLASESPPLVSSPGISVSLYGYVSGFPENPAQGFFYPQTADNQPVFVMAKGHPTASHFSRAFCGFEVYLLDPLSHKALAEYVLMRHFQLGATPP